MKVKCSYNVISYWDEGIQIPDNYYYYYYNLLGGYSKFRFSFCLIFYGSYFNNTNFRIVNFLFRVESFVSNLRILKPDLNHLK